MATNEDIPPAAVEAMRIQVSALADASDLTIPELKVDQPRARERLPAVAGPSTIVVPRFLLGAGRPTQLWHLAACLGRWASPVPRRRQRLGWAMFGVAGLVYVTLIVLFPTATWVWLTIALLYPLSAWAARWERRGMEDAGRRILAAAGHDPAAIARQAFGDLPEPTWWGHLLANEPSPRERIAAAEAVSPPG